MDTEHLWKFSSECLLMGSMGIWLQVQKKKLFLHSWSSRAECSGSPTAETEKHTLTTSSLKTPCTETKKRLALNCVVKVFAYNNLGDCETLKCSSAAKDILL